jgi:hypothetical protein
MKLQLLWSVQHDRGYHAEECYELADYHYQTALEYAKTRCAISAYLLVGNENEGCTLIGSEDGAKALDEYQCISVRVSHPSMANFNTTNMIRARSS